MPTEDYNSTARALAQTVDDTSPEREPSNPIWQRHYANNDGASSPLTYREQAMKYADIIQTQAYKTYRRFTPLQRILIGIAAVIGFILSILFLVYNERLFAWLAPKAHTWRETSFGWLVIWIGILIVSFPPLIGYSSLVTAAGFIYGVPKGFVFKCVLIVFVLIMHSWLIVASATVVGSTTSLILSRTILSSYVERFVAKEKRFEALSLVLKHDGLKLLVFWRLCPLPYSLSNGAIAMVPTVPWTTFALATAITTPKLLIHVFIGSRLAALGESGEKMDAKTKAVNYVGIALGMCFGVTTGYIIYNKTKQRAAELEAQQLEEGGSEAPRLSREYSDDAVVGRENPNLRQGRDDISLHDNHEDAEYEDFWSDEDDAFRHGDEDDDEPRGRASTK